MPEHVNATDPELHEPKGISTASVNEVYVADGLGSGNWYPIKYHFGGYVPFDSATPAATHSVTTSDTVFNPTFTETHAEGFTILTSPNARIRYDGTPDAHVFLNFQISSQQASGSNKDIEYVIYKNGVAEDSSRIIRTASTSSWDSASIVYDQVLSTNDYLEVFIKGSGACTLDVASCYLTIHGTAEA